MPYPGARIPQTVREEIERLADYGWNSGNVAAVLSRRLAVKLPTECVKAFRGRTACPQSCRDHCPFDAKE